MRGHSLWEKMLKNADLLNGIPQYTKAHEEAELKVRVMDISVLYKDWKIIESDDIPIKEVAELAHKV